MTGVEISSPKNPEVVALKRLGKYRRDREEEGVVIVEGVRLIRDILHSGCYPQRFYYCGDTSLPSDVFSLISEIEASGNCVVKSISSAAMKSASTTVSPPGIMCTFPHPDPYSILSTRKHLPLALLLDNVSDPGW